MKQKKRTMFMLLALVLLLVGVLAACGGSGSKSGVEAPTGSPAPAKTDEPKKVEPSSSKLFKINVITGGSGLPAPADDFVKQGLDKALNIDLNFNVYPSADDYTNQLNVRMASGNFPDLFAVDRPQLKEFVKQGLLLDFTPYLDKLKDVRNLIGEDSLKKGMVDGKVYAIAKSPLNPSLTYWIRQDWLDKLGLKVPTTLDELMNVATAFTNNDPDGNGKKDTYGITGQGLQAFAPIFGAFGVGGDTPSFYVRDGQIVTNLYDPGMPGALAYIKDLIAAKVVDPELLANTGIQHREKAIKGQAGILYAGVGDRGKDDAQVKSVNPNANWIQIAPPQGPGGKYDGVWDAGSTWGRIAIPKALEKDQEKLQRIFDLLNYISDQKKGARLVMYGVEGKHYNVVNGKVVKTDLMSKEAGYTYLYQWTGRPELEYVTTKSPEASEWNAFAQKTPRIQILNGLIDYPEGYKAADADRFIKEELAKFVYGQQPLTGYDNFLKTLDTTFKFNTYRDSAISQLKSFGYGK
ncbi:extracellular solute-binding protein [Paenibacillus cymbidii]|uniref:extracellular solute-binding protein n=1 Tax=Paenibacillus cymbidii TaxID=1639034 RepID=UPI001F1DBFC7|nr:extracellular solute-binding protein [Paenibacillus cymbidii]